MVRLFKVLAAAVLFGIAAASSASAAPLSGSAGAAAGAPSELIQVHGWHPHCKWGPVRYHRHHPYYGNVKCKRRHWKKRGRCHRVRHRCADYWGWGNRDFRRCVRKRDC